MRQKFKQLLNRNMTVISYVKAGWFSRGLAQAVFKEDNS